MKLTNYIKDQVQLLDGELRVNHEECSAGEDHKQRLWMKRVDDGVVCYCHNCGERLFVKIKKAESLFEDLTKPSDLSSNTLHISDFTQNISKEGLLWLFKYDITLEEIEEFKIGYSPSMNRLILPVYKDSELVYWQGRALEEEQKPKYLNPKGVQPVPFNRSTTGSRERYRAICIVEDIISAIKVGRVQDTYAILGSKIPKDLWYKLIDLDKVNIWLDKDKEKESHNKVNHLCMYTTARSIVTDKDPKEYNTEEIKKYIRRTI